MIGIPLPPRVGCPDYAVVDDEDAALSEHRWYRNTKGYVIRSVVRDGRRTSVGIHRMIMEAPAGLEVDHIDGDKLNNCRSNLRLVTHAQQTQNRSSDRGSSSRFRGVSWHRGHGRWMAYATLSGVAHHLGYFDREEDAAAAASAFRLEHMTHTNESRMGAVA